MSVNLVVRMTRSQQMALVDILVAYMRIDDEPQEFVDVSTDTTTTPGELLRLIGDMRELEIVQAAQS